MLLWQRHMCSMGMHAGCCAVPGGRRTRQSEFQLQKASFAQIAALLQHSHFLLFLSAPTHAAGADPCLANALGETPVMMASQRGLAQLLPSLVAAGGAAALAMRGGRLAGCPLHFAAEHAPLETARFLVSSAPEGG